MENDHKAPFIFSSNILRFMRLWGFALTAVTAAISIGINVIQFLDHQKALSVKTSYIDERTQLNDRIANLTKQIDDREQALHGAAYEDGKSDAYEAAIVRLKKELSLIQDNLKDAKERRTEIEAILSCH